MKWSHVIVVLLIGWCLGAACGLLFMHQEHGFLAHGGHSHRMRDRFARALNLSPEQQLKIAPIFEASHQKIAAIFEANRVPLEAVRASTRDQIRALLDPQQQVKFDQMDAKMAAHFKKRFEEGPNRWH